jgi:hypothetical protein
MRGQQAPQLLACQPLVVNQQRVHLRIPPEWS